ncbi:MAG: glycosyltransferase, partial [Methanocalculus sp.]|uniref:glycosyltransferase n=1 Tax=Methanocalculus sp. TaxID=2004547 RepID=UPI00271D4446
MKVAVFHDYFGSIGGGERVALALAEVFGADIITTDTDSLAMLPSNQRILSLGRTVKSPPFKQMSAAYLFSSCDFREDYDLFIFSGNWAHHAAKRHHPNLMYCHTPVRALYDLYETFCSRLPLHKRLPFRIWASIYRRLDQTAISAVDAMIANSENTRRRIDKYHGRNADVIYPPIDTKRFACKRYGDFWLSVNRLYPEKRIELQIESFRNFPDERLIIVGGSAEGDHAGRAYAKQLADDLPDNVEIRGEVSEDKLLDLYATCKGVICTAM